jgi:hypothetical protein
VYQPTANPKQLLDDFTKKSGNLWRELDELRFTRLKKSPWEKIYFAPRELFVNMFKKYFPSNDLAVKVTSFKAFVLGAWRATQGIYRFDEVVYESVVSMDTPTVIPMDLFLHMPEWCVYVETPNLKLKDDLVFGFFAALELESNEYPKLVLLIQTNKTLETCKIALKPGEDLRSCLQASVLYGYFFSCLENEDDSLNALIGGSFLDKQADLLAPFLNLLLFICTQSSEIGDGLDSPKKPIPTKTKLGLRLFPPNSPKEWGVGTRLGASLRLALSKHQKSDATGLGASPRPHIRRAHWHGFRSGAMKRGDGSAVPVTERKFQLRWLPPIAINVDDVEALPSTIRTVTVSRPRN